MSSAWSQLEQMLTCAICLDKFKNPRLLPCQHSFCGDACMDGLVDYARRQIKCPECRAEHRIPYQGVSSLPLNVTLIRFLELHSRITGEEPEPVPTFMEKCSICGEKVDGVQRCFHCDKKVCPECKEAHIDLLRREVNRINSQSKRCLGKLQEFQETLVKSEERLAINKSQVRREIEESCRRLIEDAQAKQRRLLDEVDSYSQAEQKTIDKLKVAVADELKVLEANSRLADDKISSSKFQWTDQELSEMKEIYAKAMEFVRLFDPEIGDFTRKMRFTLIPEFETLRRRLCELGELKFAESASSQIASSLSYCNATGQVAIELCQAAQAQAISMQSNNGATGAANYGLSHSSSNSQLGGALAAAGGGSGAMLELPSMQNALMRSQSDHRLASQFQQRLKQQQEAAAAASQATKGAGAYGASAAGRYGARGDYESDALRSRYAPPRSSATSGGKDYANDLLTRDWPRPSDNEELSFGSSIQFKSAFMRRKEKERQQLGGAYAGAYGVGENDDDDATSEASYGGGGGGRNVRFYSDHSTDVALKQAGPKLLDCREVEHGPLSGIPKLDDSPHVEMRLHQMGAKAIVDKKLAEEEGQRDKDLLESARQAMSKASERAARQSSEDEVERQKRAAQQAPPPEPVERPRGSQESLATRHSSATPTGELNSSASTVIEAATASGSQPSTPPTPAAAVAGGRRGLYGQAVTEKSRRQLSSAIQDAAAYTRRRAAAGSSVDADGETGAESGNSSAATSGGSSGRARRAGLRASGRSLSKQSSLDQSEGAVGRRRRLTRAESSQQSAEESQSKNLPTGSGGHSDNASQLSLTAGRSGAPPSSSSTSTSAGAANRWRADSKEKSSLASARHAHTEQTSTTTDDDEEEEEEEEEPAEGAAQSSYQSRSRRPGQPDSSPERSDQDQPGARNQGNRRSRELLPNAVNKLLDRSAQIRRDSQEQRQRQDSPGPRDYAPYYSRAREPAAYSSSRQRLAYQRSRDDEEPSGNNSSNSVYTTASSAARSSLDEDNSSASTRRRSSGHSTDRTLVTPGPLNERPAYRRDSGGESAVTSGYQSRFLARSRTSAGLASSRQESSTGDDSGALDTPSSSAARAYLSSRDRFMQSVGSSSSASNSVSLDRAQPASFSRGNSTGSSAGFKSHSEYLRNKFASNSSSSLARSRSSHSTLSKDQPEESDSEEPTAGLDTADELDEDQSELVDRNERPAADSVYSSKGRMLFKLGSRGCEPGDFTWPRGVAVGLGARQREIVVADSSNHRVQIFDTTGTFLHEFGSYGSGPAQFDCLAGVAINARRRSYVVSDRYNHRVQLFDLEGNFLRTFGELGRDQAKFNLPWGVACDPSGLIYVCDKENHRVQVFDPDGTHLSKFGSAGKEPGQLQHPHYIAAGPGAKLVLTDTNNHRVQVFDLAGRLISTIGREGSLNGQFKFPRGVAVDDLGNIIVGDSGNNRLQIFNSEGLFLKSIGTWGSADGEFKGIEGVAVDGSRNILVCDRENHRIQVF